ncbi:hypothetical protein KHA93_05950 [Bacillus sp. FJAT-49732]|uniref:Uncharacterized protein n=1 Tax=Lederbergia citrisecunda TaxID=2833583 RepID=A0A942TM32_9BACI|nr:hypothetical protein [Lederbergia citrisecunda]MBS4199197.1 hypothetical protein [Lederbergia citrisecunda]
MFKAAVYLVHGLIFILVILIGIGPMFSIAAPDPDQTHGAWVSMIAIFNILVLVSAFVQLRIKKVWVFLISTIGLIALFILTLQYINPSVVGLF